MTPPLLIALDLAVVLILAVLIAELARLRRRPAPVAGPIERPFEFIRPPEWGPIDVSRDVIDHMRNAIFYSQLEAVTHKRYRRWSEADRHEWFEQWVEHREYDYVLSISGRGMA